MTEGLDRTRPRQDTREDADAQQEALMEYDDRMRRLPIEMGLLYDEARLGRFDPVQRLISELETYEWIRQAYPPELLNTTISLMRSIGAETKDAFVSEIVRIVTPMLRVRYLDVETVARLKRFRDANTEYSKAGRLHFNVHITKKQYRLSDGCSIVPGDRVVEIFWTSTGERFRGFKEVIHALEALAIAVESKPKVKAVTTATWFMQRQVMRIVGFEVLSNVKVADELRRAILAYAIMGRRDKGYRESISHDDVAFGAMSRAEFLRRYGKEQCSRQRQLN